MARGVRRRSTARLSTGKEDTGRRKKMAGTSSHKATAERIAKRFNTKYNPGEGPDIVTVQAAVKVEAPDAVKDGIRQLQGYQKRVYIAGTNKRAVEMAIEATQGTTVGVMDNHGRVIRSSSRRRKIE
jgi:hypothetical protein